MTEPAPEPDPIPVTDTIVATISAQCPEVTDEHVAMVLEAWNTVLNGEPVGTIKLDPESGNLARRVNENGIHQWKITAPDGGMWSDMSPTLPGWTKLNP